MRWTMNLSVDAPVCVAVRLSFPLKCRLGAVRRSAEVASRVGPDTKFFINFLPTAIYNPEHCLQTTIAAVQESGIYPEQICFEVVETGDVGDRKHLVNILKYYRDRGFKIALDDVGAGYSSLMALSELQPDFIKLDGELVRKASVNPLEGKIVRDLAATARQAGIIPLAEGVETAEQLRFVGECGIELTQGFIDSKPAPEPLVGANSRRCSPPTRRRFVPRRDHALHGSHEWRALRAASRGRDGRSRKHPVTRASRPCPRCNP